MLSHIETAHLFVPGRASYITTAPDGQFELNLTQASQHRADVAEKIFDPSFHLTAVFAGGYPGIAQKWPDEHTPPLGRREADLMAEPLMNRLTNVYDWNTDRIARTVKCQGDSNNSIGDVLHSIEHGYLDPSAFSIDQARGVELVTGELHGERFRSILTKALDINPARIIRKNSIHDPYGTPSTEFRGRELAPIAIVKEMVAIGLTYRVLRHVRPGEVEDLRDAEQHFNALVARLAS